MGPCKRGKKCRYCVFWISHGLMTHTHQVFLHKICSGLLFRSPRFMFHCKKAVMSYCHVFLCDEKYLEIWGKPVSVLYSTVPVSIHDDICHCEYIFSLWQPGMRCSHSLSHLSLILLLKKPTKNATIAARWKIVENPKITAANLHWGCCTFEAIAPSSTLSILTLERVFLLSFFPSEERALFFHAFELHANLSLLPS